MSELEKALKEVEQSGLPAKIDAQKKRRTKESEISYREFGKPYHLSIIMLNHGLIKGFKRMTHAEIVKFFISKGSSITSSRISNDIGFASREYGVQSLIKSMAYIKNVPVLHGNEDKYKYKGPCISCNTQFVRDARARGCVCHKCMGTKPLSRDEKKCLCGETFYPGPNNDIFCTSCMNRNNQHTESTISVYYSGVM